MQRRTLGLLKENKTNGKKKITGRKTPRLPGKKKKKKIVVVSPERQQNKNKVVSDQMQNVF